VKLEILLDKKEFESVLVGEETKLEPKLVISRLEIFLLVESTLELIKL
jgi:hypothetical protein